MIEVLIRLRWPESFGRNVLAEINLRLPPIAGHRPGYAPAIRPLSTALGGDIRAAQRVVRPAGNRS
ncbi:hypothetical protein [Streptomyces solincola]|uniref:hypothetical protein n=1 Tax=Streptomyces solincola TaxID=2100817 RepID=UPI001C612485|nr:hypothetical protein [Streptomyces solincola]